MTVGKVVAAAGILAALWGDGATAVPLPPPRPAEAPTRPADPAAAPSAAAPTPCQAQLSRSARFRPLGELAGPGGCGGSDVVLLQRVIAGNAAEVAIEPPATLRCEMAQAIADWVRFDVAAEIAGAGAVLNGVRTADSYDCRGRNRVAGAKLSEHGKADALDIAAFRLGDGRLLAPTDHAAPLPIRLAMKASACARFTTVLGPGSDGYHEDHVHLDLIARSGNYRLCQWSIPDAPEPAAHLSADLAAAPAAADPVPLPRPRRGLGAAPTKGRQP